MNKLLLSIVIPCFNDGHFLKEAIQSIVEANLEYPYEVIVVNDGSTEKETLSLLDSLATPIEVLHQENKGLGAARNAGIKKALGEFILPLDSDNKINGKGLGEAIKYIQSNAGIDIVFSDVETFSEETPQQTKKLTVPDYHKESLFLSNYIDACALYRKSNWEKVGGYDELMPYMGYEDWDFWLRCSIQKFNFAKLGTPIFKYRIRKDSMIHSGRNQERHKIVYKYLIEKYMDEYVAILFEHRKKFSHFLRKPLKAGIKSYFSIKS